MQNRSGIERLTGGGTMLRKVLLGMIVGAGTLSLAVPAYATIDTRYASFGTNGHAVVAHHRGYWSGRTTIYGLSVGTYQMDVDALVDGNHDGVPDGGSVVTVCTFTVRTSGRTARCRGRFDA